MLMTRKDYNCDESNHCEEFLILITVYCKKWFPSIFKIFSLETVSYTRYQALLLIFEISRKLSQAKESRPEARRWFGE